MNGTQSTGGNGYLMGQQIVEYPFVKYHHARNLQQLFRVEKMQHDRRKQVSTSFVRCCYTSLHLLRVSCILWCYFTK